MAQECAVETECGKAHQAWFNALKTSLRGLNHAVFDCLIDTSKLMPYKETHDLTLLDALRPFHPLRVGEAGGALSKRCIPSSITAAREVMS
jgi:hypothetical protein